MTSTSWSPLENLPQQAISPSSQYPSPNSERSLAFHRQFPDSSTVIPEKEKPQVVSLEL
jgi:hypothetical protein